MGRKAMEHGILVAVLCSSLFLEACGAASSMDTTGQETNPTEQVTEEETEMDLTAAITAEDFSYVRSSKSYDFLYEISDTYLGFVEDGKIGVMDYQENVVMEAVYDGIVTELEEDAFCLYQRTEDVYDAILYDKDLNIIYENTDYPAYYIIEYRSDMVQLWDGENYIYLDQDKDFALVATLNQETVPGMTDVSAFDNGYAVITDGTDQGEGYTCLMDREGNLSGITYEDYQVAAGRGSISPEGWLPVDLYQDGSLVESGFYNINSQSFTPIPYSGGYELLISEEGCVTSSAGGIAMVMTDPDQYLYQAMDLETGEYLGDSAYEMEDVFNASGNDIYMSQDGTYGYLDQDQQVVKEASYTDATAFDMGVALVRDGGLTYFINTDFEKISDPLGGNRVFLLGNGIFMLRLEDGFCFIRVTRK